MRVSVEVGNNFLNGSCAQTNWSILDVIDGLGLVRIYLYALSLLSWQSASVVYFSRSMTMVLEPLFVGRTTISILFWRLQKRYWPWVQLFVMGVKKGQ